MMFVITSIDYPSLPIQLPAFADTSMLTHYVHDKSVQSWYQLVRKSQLFFITRDEILDYPMPLMPHIVSLPCITCVPSNPLPAELETFVQRNNHGTIIVTFGSILEYMPDEIFHEFLNAFRKIKHNILWRYTGKNAPQELPSNIKLSKWLPQNDILGHPKTRLFVTHCGNNGQYESLYHGVPMIGFPAFAEQHHNALRMDDKQFGIKMNLLNFKSDELIQAIEMVIGSDKSVYVINAKQASEKLKSRLVTAQDKATYWVEYILKYSGKDLRSHALNMALTEFLMVDLLLCIIVVALLVIGMMWFCCKRCISFCRGTAKKQKRE